MNNGLPASLAEVIELAGRNLQAGMFTGVPAEVVTYDPVTNTISARIVVKNALFDRSGARDYESFPVIPAVPVMWPRGGGKVVRLPLEPGDSVWLAFSQAALAEWRTTGQTSEPIDSRRHSIGYPYAIPGAFPDVSPLSAADAIEVAAGAMIVGEDGGDQMIIGGTLPGVRFGKLAISPVALSVPTDAGIAGVIAAVNANTAALEAFIVVFNAHTHPVPGVTVGPGATVSSVTGTAAAAAPAAAPAAATTASLLVKSL